MKDYFECACLFCRLTLLLGPPSSGKTTLLLALAGRPGPGLQVLSIDSMIPEFEGQASIL